jgi:STE24 endopeptidase
MMAPPALFMKLLWLAILAYVLLRGILYLAQYHGNRSPQLQARVEKHFTREDIETGFEYARRGFAARIAATALDLALLLLLVFSGLSSWLADRALVWAGGRWFLQAGLFAALLVAGFFLIRLPFAYYLEYVLEHRFQFSNQSTGGWLLLQAKNLMVALVLATVASVVWFALLRAFPRGWVLVVPAAFTLLQALLVLAAPLIFLPLYFQKSPLAEGPFRDEVLELLGRTGIKAKKIFVIDESRYSTHTNAFFSGLGPTKNIYLYDTLLKDHSEQEALTIIAHEAGHWTGRHILKNLALAGAAMLVGCLLLYCLYPGLAEAGGEAWRPLRDPGSLPALLLLALLGSFFVAPLMAGISRSFEREADRAAVELTADPAAFIEAEVRLSRSNRSQLLPHPLVVFWFYSHPPAIERIAAAERRR